MKTLVCIASLTLMTTSITGQVIQPLPPDTLILKSGEIAEVRIVDQDKGDIRYHKIGDEKNIRRTPIRAFKEIIEHSFADQPFARNEKDEIIYSEVVQVEGLSSENLFNLSKSYLADTYRDLNQVIELEDKDLGIILVEGLMNITIIHMGQPFEYKIWHSLKFEMKDGRYRYQLYGFRVQFRMEDAVPAEFMFREEGKLNAAQRKIKEKMLASIALFVNDIKASIVPPSKDDKW